MNQLLKSSVILPLLELNLLRTEKWPEHSFTLPKYQAHRGYWCEGLQENTLESLMTAKKMGFQMAEFDVQLSQDNVPVLFHDSNLSRLAKKDIPLNLLSAKELKHLAQVPTLEEILQHPDVPDYLNIEIKSGFFTKATLVESVADIIRKTRAQSRVVISSFNPLSLIQLKMLIPEVPLALLASPEKAKGNYIYLRRMWATPLLRPHLLHLDYRMLNNDFLKLVEQKSLSVVAWTVNDSAEAQHLLDHGVLSIITDKKLF